MLIGDGNINAGPLSDFNQDTGLPISRSTIDLYLQAFKSIQTCNLTMPQSLLLNPYDRLASNSCYLPKSSPTLHQPLPNKGYAWMIIAHPQLN